MTREEAPAAPARLAAGAVLRAAFATVFARPALFLKAATVPFLLSLVVAAFQLAVPILAGIVETDEIDLATGLLEIFLAALSLLPLALLGVVLTRLRLDGPRAGIVPRPFPGGRVWRYFGYSLAMYLVFIFFLVGAFGFAWLWSGDSFLEEGEDALWILLALLIGFIVTFYLLLRLSLVYPAISMDDSLRLRGSWRLTRRGGFKLFLVFMLLLLLQLAALFAGAAMFGVSADGVSISVLEPGGEGRDGLAPLLAGAPQGLWNLITSLLIFGMMTGALASAYAQLTGWGAPRQDILQRFE
jgi:hypothetical protein